MAWLRQELKSGMEAAESDFEMVDVDALIAEAKSAKAKRAS